MKNAGKCWFYNIHFPVFFVEIFQMRLLSILSLQIFLRRSQHQFNTVQLVYFTGAWVVIYGNDVGLRIVLSQFLDHTFSYNVVWQAAKWLGADNVFNTTVDQLLQSLAVDFFIPRCSALKLLL